MKWIPGQIIDIPKNVKFIDPKIINLKKWDLRFLEMASLVAMWSRDPSTQCGAVLVKDNKVVGLGYNGFPARMFDDEKLYNDRDEKYSRIIHAEINCILNSNGNTNGTTLYVWPFPPCDRCAPVIIQSGIVRVIFTHSATDKLERWKDSFERSLRYFKECGVKWKEYI
jgi:dCMP deaminase